MRGEAIVYVMLSKARLGEVQSMCQVTWSLMYAYPTDFHFFISTTRRKSVSFV